MKVREATILRLEPEGAVPIELFAEPMQAKARHGDIVRGKREQQSLWSGVRGAGRFEDEVKKLRERKAELAAVVGDEG